ncbi:MAG TPA: hypothetical protein ENG03_10970 [Thioploca sp.]|nr:MAG: hypothetical protein DRR19_26625 [Gammaproteobacteria bacterium]HDN27596.1 hypothetical protein [Thioploca sp.]
MKKILLVLLLFIAYGASSPTLAQNSEPVLPSSDGRTVKLSPQVRIIKREYRIPTIQVEQIQQFFNRPKLITEEEINDAGRIITNANQSLLSTKGFRIYVSGLNEAASVGSRYMIVRMGQTYRSPLDGEEGEVLAYEAIYLGEAALDIPGEPATLNITSATREIKNGDRLLPVEERGFQEDFYPHSPTLLEDAYIIAVIDGTGSLIGKYQIVIINKGSNDDIERGHVLAVNNGSRFIRELYEEEIILPQQRVGSLLVFRVFEYVSYALVMKSNLPIRLLDEVTVP